MDTTELRGHSYATVYDAIMVRHSDWLRATGGPTTTQRPAVAVFYGVETRPRDINSLKELRPEEVVLVRHLSKTEALGSYGWPWEALVITPR